MLTFLDFEVFEKDWLMVAINPFTQTKEVIVNDLNEFKKFHKRVKDGILVTYNGLNYDQYIYKALLLGFNPKEVNDFIIVKGRKGWEYSSLFNKIKLNVFDVMPNPPVGLKTLEGFLGYSIFETSVPFTLTRSLTQEEIDETIEYCTADVMNTIEVFMRRKNEFDAQMSLIKTFNLPLENIGKTQAQLASIILGAKRKKFDDEWEIRLPQNLNLGKYKHVGDWFLDPKNHNDDASLVTNICGLEHTIAWGGIHAGLSKEIVKCADDEIILDIDVDQLYPTLMIEYGLLSRAVVEPQKFKNVLDTSLRLKAEGKKKEREPFKRICNITYGAEGDKFNPMYDPLHRKLVCVFGQVLIIDLLDKLEDIIELVNSNTDGIFVKIKKYNYEKLKLRVKLWEQRTHLHMSYDEYDSMWCGDVNNYVAIRKDGEYHSKGAYVKDLSDLDYDLPIVNEAIKDYILKGIPVEFTIRNCTELRKFQKIVKLTSKYEFVAHECGYNPTYTKRGKLIDSYGALRTYSNKAYRVFASNDINDGRIVKCRTNDKEGEPIYENYGMDGYPWGSIIGHQSFITKSKFGNTPDHCFIMNENILDKPIPSKLDYDWYVDLAKRRIEEKFGVIV